MPAHHRVHPPPRCLAFDLPNPQPASPAWAVLAAVLAVLALKGSEGLSVAVLPLVSATALDRGDARKLILPVAFASVAVTLAFLMGLLKASTFGLVVILIDAAVVAWGYANPETTVGAASRAIVGALVTLLMPRASFPDRPSNFTKSFLEKIVGYPVAKFSWKQLSGGFIGSTVRVTITPAASANGGASDTTIIVKMTPPNAAGKLRMRLGANVFVKETAFYLSIAPVLRKHSLLRLPETLAVHYGRFSGSNVIVMKDEGSTHAPGDEERPASWEMACSVAKRYASFHALYAQPSLAELDAMSHSGWLATFDWMSKPKAFLADLLKGALEEVLINDEMRACVPQSLQRVVVRFMDRLPELIKHLEATRAFSIVHADVRVENLLFPKSSNVPHTCAGDCEIDLAYDSEPWLALDWQTMTKAMPVYDLAYFVTLDLDVTPGSTMATVDQRLCEFYHSQLNKPWYTAEACLFDYRLGCLFASMIPFVVMSAKSIGEQTTGRAQVVRLAMLRRACATLIRIRAGEVLDAALAGILPPPRILCTAAREVVRAKGVSDLMESDDAFSHHTPESVAAFPQTGKPGVAARDAYDRWWLNAQSPDGTMFFALAMGFYPGRQVTDATFCFSAGGMQRNFRESRPSVPGDYGSTDTTVGSIRVVVTNALVSGRVTVNAKGCKAELDFTGRIPPRKEPRFDMDLGAVGQFNYERLTQLVSWSGFIELASGERILVNHWHGVRDRSWGRRPHTAADKPTKSNAQRSKLLGLAPARALVGAVMSVVGCPSFYWLWCPTNFTNGGGLLVHSQEDPHGLQTNAGAHLFLPDQSELPLSTVQITIVYREGTRHLKACEVIVRADDDQGSEMCITYTPVNTFFMTGVGYNADEFCHGRSFGGVAASKEDTIAVENTDHNHPAAWHIQEVCTVSAQWISGSRASAQSAGPITGSAVLEQLILGPHAPSGFQRLYDVA